MKISSLSRAGAISAIFLLTTQSVSLAAEAGGATRSGASGLVRTVSASRLPAGASLLRIESAYFTAKSFMLEGYGHRSVDWSLAYTHSGSEYTLFERFEFGLAIEGRSDVIQPPDDAARSNGYFGNTTASVKAALLRSGRFNLSLLLDGRTNAPAQKGQTGLSSLSPTVATAGTVDLDPVFLHLNLGAYLDRSEKALDRDERTLDRAVRFAQGTYVDTSWLAGMGFETRWRFLSAYLDLFTYQDMDGKFLSSAYADDTSERRAVEKIGFSQNPIWLTPGVRVPVANRWQLEAAADLGFLSGDFPGSEDRGILPPWRAIVAIAYLTGMPRGGSSATHARHDSMGQVVAEVVDALTGKPIAGAAVFIGGEESALAAIPGGHFVAGLSPGSHALRAVGEGYEPGEKTIEVREGGDVQITFKLEKPKPKPAEVVAAEAQAKAREEAARAAAEAADRAAAEETERKSREEAVRAAAEEAERAAKAERESEHAREMEVARLEPPSASPITELVALTQKVQFKFDRAVIDPDYFPALDEIVRLLQDHPEVILRIVGHTDETGPSGLNRWVSLKRATAIADYIASKGIDRKRLVPVGMGFRQPVAPNTDLEGRMRNRRVDFNPFEPAPWHVEFGYDQVALPPNAAGILDEIVRELRVKPELNIEVTGHSDSVGTPDGIMRVSIVRARAAAKGLSSRGVSSDRMKVEGRGDLEPVSSNADPAGQALNRRVDFRLYRPQPTPEKISTN